MSTEENKDNNSSRPHIHIFGEEVGSSVGGGDARHEEERENRRKWREERERRREEWRNSCPRRHHGSMMWGLLILLVGLILLFNGMGLISHAFWVAILPFWPVILIIWGIDILLGSSWLGRILSALIAIILCVLIIAYGLAKVNPAVANSFPSNINSLITQSQQSQINK